MGQEKYDAFCIDSSALIDLHKYYGQQLLPELWTELGGLFDGGQVISHRIVFDELTTNAGRPSDLSKWVKARRKCFIDMTAIQMQFVADIVKKFPQLIDPKQEKDQADPWIIALVLERTTQRQMFTASNNIAVVSQENPLSSIKIPAVCKHYDLGHLSLTEFFAHNNWTFSFSKV